MSDTFNNFAELEERVSSDAWETESRGGNAKWVIIAAHGGTVEPGTDQLADLIAGHDLSCYVFRGKVSKNVVDLHINSTHFDDPVALDLLSLIDIAIAIDGVSDASVGDGMTLIGGGNLELGHHIAATLDAAGYPTKISTGRLVDEDPANICNRCRSGRGVQLELSHGLREHLMSNSAAMYHYASIVRQALGL